MTRTRHHALVVAFLKHTQHDFNLGIRALGRATGVDPTHLSRVLEGKYKFHRSTIVALLTKMGEIEAPLWRGIAQKARALQEAGKHVS